MVSSERQVFKCFGCGEGGDVFSFLEKMESWDFRETLEELAKRVGVKLSQVKTDRSKTRDKLISINNLVSKFYSHLLNKHPLGAKAREYLLGRGIKKPLWEKFTLGYAPVGWENSLVFLKKRGFSIEDIALSGLIVSSSTKRGSFYDRFRNRLIFPLKDSHGSTLGFSARIIEQEVGNEPKYINSPETPIFNKGSLLFGLDIARGAIREKNEIILVEGEFDVLSLHGIGVLNVVASKGTALTDKQVVVISRHSENVSLCFDTDLAGDAAARRGIELLDLAGVNVKVIRLSKYKDPDEFAQVDPKGFKEAIESASNIYDYFIESVSARFDAKSVIGKKKIGQEILPMIAKISDDLVRAHYIEKLAKILDLDIQLVTGAVDKKVEGLFVNDSKSETQSVGRSIDLEEYFLALFISQEEPEFELVKILAVDDFQNEQSRAFWKWLRDIIKTSKTKSFKKLLIKLPKNLGGFVDNLYLVNISPTFGDKESWGGELVKISKRIKEAAFKRKLKDISELLKSAQVKSDQKKIAILTKKFDEISSQLRQG